MRSAIKLGWVALLLSLAFPMLAKADEADPGDKIARFVGTIKGTGWGMPAMILEVQMPPDSTQITKIAVPNQDPMGKYDPNHVVTKNLEGVKPGDLLIIKTETDEGTTGVAKLGHYSAKPGEDEPGSFIFVESGGDADHPTVSLSRFGQVGVLAVAAKKDDAGKMAPDADVVAAIATFKKGDVVIAKLKPGRAPALASIEAYTPPLTGTFVSVINSTVVDGQPHPAIDIKTDAGMDSIIPLPGTTNKAGKWIVDPDLFRAVRRLHAKTPIEYRTSGSGDQAVLKDIAVAKAAPASS
jgi:hypothetical protein